DHDAARGTSIAGTAFGPDDDHVDVGAERLIDDVCCAAVAAGRLAIPDGDELVDVVEHVLGSSHVGFGRGLVAGQAVNCPSGRQQAVIGGVVAGGQAGAVLVGGDDDLELATVIKDGLGEEGVGAVGDTGHADQLVGRVLGDLGAEGGVDHPDGRWG